MTKMETILNNVKDTVPFQAAVECISNSFHNYDGEEDCVFEDGMLEDFEYEYSDPDTGINFVWGSGVSKVALVCTAEDGNSYALKTAYEGYAYLPVKNKDENEDEENEKDEEEEEEWAFESYNHINECRVEYLVYRAAVAAGLGHFFAEMIKINSDVYMQEKYDISVSRLENETDDFGLYISQTLIERFRDKNSKHYLYFNNISRYAEELGLEDFYECLKENDDSFLMFCSRYSRMELLRLQAFLNEYDINDLHSSNIGMFGNDIKFIDYCGYCSNTSSKVGA